MHVYRVDAFGYLFAAMVVLFTLLGLLVLLPSALRGGANDPPLPFALVWLAILGWFWFNVLRSPYEVRVGHDGNVEFRRIVGTVSLSATQITRIRGLPLFYGTVVYHAGGRIWLRAPIRDSFKLFNELSRLNPSLEIRGV